MTTCNLATAIAQNNKKVLLVDADMRKPRIAGIFNKKTGKGLSQFLSGQAGYEEVVQQTDIENLSHPTARWGILEYLFN